MISLVKIKRIKQATLYRLATSIAVLFFICCGGKSSFIELEKHLTEINRLAADDNGSRKQLSQKLKNQLHGSHINANFPKNRDELELAARLARPHFQHDISRFTKIAEKYREIESLGLNEKATASANLQRRLYEKYAIAVQLEISKLELLLDKSITTRKALLVEATKIEERIENLAKEIAELEKESKKQDNDQL